MVVRFSKSLILGGTGIRCLVVTGFLIGGFFAPLTAQDSADQQDTTDEAAVEQSQTQETELAPNEADASKGQVPLLAPERRTLYFIGPRFPVERQQGPSIGKPKVILPQPLVARGSLSVPVPTQGEVVIPHDDGEAPALDEQAENAAPSEDADGTPPLTEPDQLGRIVDNTSVQNGQSVDPLVAIDDSSLVLEGDLLQIDPSGLPVSGLDSSIDTVWQGYSRDEIVVFLGKLGRVSRSPTMNRLGDSIASSSFTLPQPEDEADIVAFIRARLDVFQSHANRQAYLGLIEGLPADRDWSALAHHVARAHLLKGELTDACLIAENERASDDDIYWVRLAAFCMAATGNRTGVDFQLGILEETITLEPAFYQLLDQILVEAEQPTGAVLPPMVTIAEALPADILTATMARLARVVVPDVQETIANPLAVPLLLENPMLSRPAQSKLVNYLVSLGVADGAAVAEFARALQTEEEERTEVLAEDTDGSAANDATPDSSDIEANENADGGLDFDDAVRRAILMAIIAQPAPSYAEAHDALQKLWTIAGDTGQRASVSSALVAMTMPGFEKNSEMPAATLQAILARAAQLSGDTKAAANWSRALRNSVAGQDEDTDRALINLWPLIAIRDGEATTDTGRNLSLWWRAQSEVDSRFRKANLVFSVFDALDMPVPDDLWGELEAGPAVFEGRSVAPSVWRAFLKSLDNADPVYALSSLFGLLSQSTPADLPPSVVSTLIAGLKQLGFEDHARMLALEILISQKI